MPRLSLVFILLYLKLQRVLLNSSQYVSNRYRLSDYGNCRVKIVQNVQSWDTQQHNDVSTKPERKEDIKKK